MEGWDDGNDDGDELGMGIEGKGLVVVVMGLFRVLRTARLWLS